MFRFCDCKCMKKKWIFKIFPTYTNKYNDYYTDIHYRYQILKINSDQIKVNLQSSNSKINEETWTFFFFFYRNVSSNFNLKAFFSSVL